MASELAQLSADRLSFFLQHVISMPIYKLNLYLNIYQELVHISAYKCIPIEAGSWLHRLFDDSYRQIVHIYTHFNSYMLIP